MRRGHKGKVLTPHPPTEHGSKQVTLVIVTVNKIDVMLQNDLAQSTEDTEVEFAAFFNLVEGQPTGTCLVRDTKLPIPYIPNIGHYDINQRAVVSFSRQ